MDFESSHEPRSMMEQEKWDILAFGDGNDRHDFFGQRA